MSIKDDDKLSVQQLLHLSRDHFLIGCCLLENSTLELTHQQITVSSMESGGYLIHLGFELLLKAFCRYNNKKYPLTHKLTFLKKKCGSDISQMLDTISFSVLDTLKKEPNKTMTEEDFFNEMDNYNTLKYCDEPTRRDVGNEFIPLIEEVFNTIIEKMPEQLKIEYQKIDWTKKAGATLIEKAIN